MKLYTIGFTKKSAEEFFETLKIRRVKHLVDVRLNPDSHLAGFARQLHLVYFLNEICQATYEHDCRFAPSENIFTAYRDGDINWEDYERSYLELLENRVCEKRLELKESSCLLCSEKIPRHCHRRLAAEYLVDISAVDDVIHL